MKGEMLALMAAFLWGIAPIFDKLAITNSISLPLANFIRSFGAFLTLAFLVLFLREFSFAAFNVKRIVFLLIAGSIAGGIAMIIFYMALRQIGAGRTVPLSSIYPLFTILFSALFLEESISLKVVVGTVLIVAGVVLVSD
jgi:transporter family protein